MREDGRCDNNLNFTSYDQECLMDILQGIDEENSFEEKLLKDKKQYLNKTCKDNIKNNRKSLDEVIENAKITIKKRKI